MIAIGTRRTATGRRSIRLRGYDYRRQGLYFITLCTRQRGAILGDIKDGGVRLNRLGRIVAASWLDLPRHHKNVLLDDWVVMPDHVHGIIALVAEGVIRAVEAIGRPGPPQGSVGSIIGSFKASATRRINATPSTRGVPLWQRGYYERIIRDSDALERVRRYIRNNPRRWWREATDMSGRL